MTVGAMIIAGSITKINAAVGDFYYSDGSYSSKLDSKKTCVGIIFRNKTAREKGLVVSLDEAVEKKWENVYSITGANDFQNGATNMKIISSIIAADGKTWTDFPAYEWIHTTKNGGGTAPWYLPAKNEMDVLYSVWNKSRDGFNAKLTEAGGKELSVDWYWGSTEAGQHTVWSGALNYEFPTATFTKTSLARVRAIRAF